MDSHRTLIVRTREPGSAPSGFSVPVDPGIDPRGLARRITDEGCWDEATQTFYPSRAIFSVRVAAEDGGGDALVSR
ncbi:MAG: hypothetical protein JWM27_2190 [Gemmatimonadetes bacterium]|nr:hypothetical protein [Gemmatimonadota bacterium]